MEATTDNSNKSRFGNKTLPRIKQLATAVVGNPRTLPWIKQLAAGVVGNPSKDGTIGNVLIFFSI